MDVKQTATTYADQMGVGPNDSSTINKTQDAVSQGIETVQSSVFGQKAAQDSSSSTEQKQKPDVPEVDRAHPAAVEEFMREKHRSEPVTGKGKKE